MADDVSDDASLNDELGLFALKLAKDMQKSDVPFAQKLDAFRALTAYHSASAKTKKPISADGDHPDDQPAVADFQTLKRRMKVVGEDDANGSVEASGSR